MDENSEGNDMANWVHLVEQGAARPGPEDDKPDGYHYEEHTPGGRHGGSNGGDL